jgi:hypothetical protein
MSEELRGTIRVQMGVMYRRPGECNKNSHWTKVVTLHVEHSVTAEQAQEIVNKWKQVNQDVVGTFTAAVY